MKLWQYYGLLCGIWLAPAPIGSWTVNLVMALVMGLFGIYYCLKGD